MAGACNRLRINLSLTFFRRNRGPILFVFLPTTLGAVLLGLYLIARVVLSPVMSPGALVVVFFWTIIWAIAAAFLTIAASYRVRVDSNGITVRKLTRGDVLIPWHQIRNVRIRGDTSKYGLYRTARAHINGQVSHAFVEMVIDHFTELLIVLKCYLDLRNGSLPVDGPTAGNVTVSPGYWDSVIMPEGLRWSDAQWIAIALHEAFPCIDPQEISDSVMRSWITSLRGFHEENKQSADIEMIVDIRAKWLSLFRQYSLFMQRVSSALFWEKGHSPIE